LSHFLLDAYGPLDLVLVEREAVRFKAERSMGADAAKRRDAQINDERRLAQKRRALAKKTSPRPTFRENENVDEEVFDDLSAERDAETVRVRRAGASVERLRVDIKDLCFLKRRRRGEPRRRVRREAPLRRGDGSRVAVRARGAE